MQEMVMFCCDSSNDSGVKIVIFSTSKHIAGRTIISVQQDTILVAFKVCNNC